MLQMTQLIDAFRTVPVGRVPTICTRAHCDQPPYDHPAQAEWAGLCALHHDLVAETYNRLERTPGGRIRLRRDRDAA